jgi:ribosomal protein S18 acetylase RimI-like enzyme
VEVKNFWKSQPKNIRPAETISPSGTGPKKDPAGGGSRPAAAERIRLLEEISLNAWPAFQTSLYDGWVIRFADGFSRRSNSIIPLYPSHLNVMDKIRLCEAMCRERGQRTVFKLTGANEPRELDLILSDEGYRPEAETGMRTLSLRDAAGVPEPDVLLRETFSDEWVSALCRLNAYEPRHHPTVAALTRLIDSPRAFVSIQRGGKIIGCGLGVIRQGFLGFFDIVVGEEFRRQGLGRQIMHSLLDWGSKRSAATAFLQVMTNNPVAMEMYSGLGFREEYRYVYWAKA